MERKYRVFFMQLDERLQRADEVQRELFEIGCIDAGTSFHRSREGHWIKDGGNASAIPGVQLAASWYKGHSPALLFPQLTELEARVREAVLSLELPDEDSNLVTRRKISFLETLDGACGTIEGYARAQAGSEGAFEIDSLGKRLKEIANRRFQPEHHPAMELRPPDWEYLQRLGRQDSGGIQQPVSGVGFHLTESLGRALHTLGIWERFTTMGSYEGGTLILGALPLCGITRDDTEELKEVKSVLTIMEPHELQAGAFMNPAITGDEWKKRGVHQLILVSKDYHGVSQSLLDQAVEFLHQELKGGKTVLAHCKAGHGRSALVVMCYLILHHGMTMEGAYNVVKEKRWVFGESDPKMESLKTFSQRALQKN